MALLFFLYSLTKAGAPHGIREGVLPKRSSATKPPTAAVQWSTPCPALVTKYQKRGMNVVFAIAFAGKIGSGKTTISTAVAQALACKRASFGDYVRFRVAELGVELTRENLQRIGTELLESDRLGFCRDVLLYAGWSEGESIVIDGLRHRETIPLLNKILSPAYLRIVYIDVDEQTRVERLVPRRETDVMALASADAHSSEQQLAAIERMADMNLDGRNPLPSSVAAVLEWMAKQ